MRRGSERLLKTLTWTTSLVVVLMRGPGNIPLMVMTCTFPCTVFSKVNVRLEVIHITVIYKEAEGLQEIIDLRVGECRRG